jgi:hypothetical protein
MTAPGAKRTLTDFGMSVGEARADIDVPKRAKRGCSCKETDSLQRAVNCRIHQ